MERRITAIIIAAVLLAMGVAAIFLTAPVPKRASLRLAPLRSEAASSIPIQNLVNMDSLTNLNFEDDFRPTYITGTDFKTTFQDQSDGCSRRGIMEADGIAWRGTDASGNEKTAYFRWKADIRLPKTGRPFRKVGYIQYADTGSGDEEDSGEEGRFDEKTVKRFNQLACDGYAIIFISAVQARDTGMNPIGTVACQLGISCNRSDGKPDNPDALNWGRIMEAAYKAICAVTERGETVSVSLLTRDGPLALSQNYIRMATFLQLVVKKLYGAGVAGGFKYAAAGGSKWGTTSWYAAVLDDRVIAARPSGSAMVGFGYPGGIIDRWIHDRFGWDPRAKPFKRLGELVRGCFSNHRYEVPGYVDTFTIGNYAGILKSKKIFSVLGTSDEPNPFGSDEPGFQKLKAAGGQYATLYQIDKGHGGDYIIDGEDAKILAIMSTIRAAGGEKELPRIYNASVNVTPAGGNQCRYDISLNSNLRFDKIRVHAFASSNTGPPGDNYLYNCDNNSDGDDPDDPDDDNIGLCAKTKTYQGSDFTVSGSRMSKSVTDNCLNQERLWFILEGQKNKIGTGGPEPEVIVSSDLIRLRDWRTKCPHGAIANGCLAKDPAQTGYYYYETGNACLGVQDQRNDCETIALTASPLSSRDIVLSWNNIRNEQGFEVLQSADGQSFSKIAEAGANITQYTVHNLLAATSYYYRVRPWNADATFDSNTAEGTTLAEGGGGGGGGGDGGDGGGGGGGDSGGGTKLAAPSQLTARPVSANKIALTWKDNSSDEEGFKIEQSSDGVKFSLSVSTSQNFTQFTVGGLRPATSYFFRTRAFRGSSVSAFSNTVSATTFESPPEPTPLPEPKPSPKPSPAPELEPTPALESPTPEFPTPESSPPPAGGPEAPLSPFFSLRFGLAMIMVMVGALMTIFLFRILK